MQSLCACNSKGYFLCASNVTTVQSNIMVHVGQYKIWQHYATLTISNKVQYELIDMGSFPISRWGSCLEALYWACIYGGMIVYIKLEEPWLSGVVKYRETSSELFMLHKLLYRVWYNGAYHTSLCLPASLPQQPASVLQEFHRLVWSLWWSC